MENVSREMTFEEEYTFLKKEAKELFDKEDEESEPPKSHSVVRRALRCIKKLITEVKPYKEYKDLEEQGLLLRLPCKVGSTVYAICTCEAVGTVLDGTLYGSNGGFGTATGYYCPYELSDKCPHTEADDCEECKNIENVFEDTVDYINITEYEVIIGLKNTNLCVTIDEIGKTVFLTKEEAEQKLKEMEGNGE